MSESLSRKVVVITGGTDGIGAETAKKLASLGMSLYLVGRNVQRGQALISALKAQTGNLSLYYIQSDLTIQQQIYKVVDQITQSCEGIDVLINNAGAIFGSYSMTSDGIEKTMALNHFAPFLLTLLLWDSLQKRQARIITVSSEAHKRVARFDMSSLQRGKKGYNGWLAYCESKLANLLFTYALARRVKDSGVTAYALHPGFVATSIGYVNRLMPRMVWKTISMFARTPEQGAETPTFLASSPHVLSSHGLYFIDCKPASSSPFSYDIEAQESLWTRSMQLVDRNRLAQFWRTEIVSEDGLEV